MSEEEALEGWIYVRYIFKSIVLQFEISGKNINCNNFITTGGLQCICYVNIIHTVMLKGR